MTVPTHGQIGLRAVAILAEAALASNVGARRAALCALDRARRDGSAAAGEALIEVSRSLPQEFVAETLSGEYRRHGEERYHQRLVGVVRHGAAVNKARLVSEGVDRLYGLAQHALSPIDHRIIDSLVAMLDWSGALARREAGDVLQWGLDVAFAPSLAHYTETALQRRSTAEPKPTRPKRSRRR